MALMTFNLTDIGEESLAGRRPRVWWMLNRTTLHDGGTVVVNVPKEATLNGTRGSINVAPTAHGEWYTIRVEVRDEYSDRLVYTRDLDRKIEVPEEGGDLSGSTAISIGPDRVLVQLETPTDTTWPFWLQAAIGDPDPGTSTGSGDLYRRVE